MSTGLRTPTGMILGLANQTSAAASGTCSALDEPGSLRHQVIPFRDTRGAGGGHPVMCDGSRMVTSHFQKMGANCVETIVARNSTVCVERCEQFQTLGGTVYHSRCNCVIEGYHGVGGHTFQQIVKSKYLRPIGVLGSKGIIMNGSDRSL